MVWSQEKYPSYIVAGLVGIILLVPSVMVVPMVLEWEYSEIQQIHISDKIPNIGGSSSKYYVETNLGTYATDWNVYRSILVGETYVVRISYNDKILSLE